MLDYLSSKVSTVLPTLRLTIIYSTKLMVAGAVEVDGCLTTGISLRSKALWPTTTINILAKMNTASMTNQKLLRELKTTRIYKIMM